MSDVNVDPKTGATARKTARMFFTSWRDPVWQSGQLDAGRLGREAQDGPAGKGVVKSAIFDYGASYDNPIRCFIFRADPGAVISPHDHPYDYCSVLVEGSVEIGGQNFVPGEIRFVKAETVYGPINVGSTGATILEFHAGLEAAYEVFSPRKVFTAPWIR